MRPLPDNFDHLLITDAEPGYAPMMTKRLRVVKRLMDRTTVSVFIPVRDVKRRPIHRNRWETTDNELAVAMTRNHIISLQMSRHRRRQTRRIANTCNSKNRLTMRASFPRALRSAMRCVASESTSGYLPSITSRNAERGACENDP